MEIDFKPKACQGDDATYEGSITMRVPTFCERYEYMEKAGFKIGDDGGIEANMEQMGAIRRMVEFSKAHYLGVNLKRLDDGAQFTSFDELQNDPGCDAILIEFAMACMTGVKPGKN